MKLLIIFDKEIEISPEKVCVHVGHSTREITLSLHYDLKLNDYNKWRKNSYKTVILKDKITDFLIDKIKNNYLHYYCVWDAGLDGVFAPGTILGFAVLVPEADETFKRLRTLKF